ncbi:MAG: polysaccharide pyruvyl transferase family protein [Planctomycetaceae bacterium]|nr:polysaccharide pyruvyl transferase family protein [Planctomycetaceae bacterium]
MKIGMPGASLDTGNYGVSALAEASIKCLLERWPEAEFVFLASGRAPKVTEIVIGHRHYSIPNLPIRFCRNIFLKNHYVNLFAAAMLLRIFGKRAISIVSGRNAYVKEILSIDRIADITGGDSFTDMYGTRRFIQGGMVKYLWMVYRKPIYFLPQTYGPFRRGWVQRWAKFLLTKAAAILCRDRSGYDSVRQMFASRPLLQQKAAYVPDVAFVLDAHPFADPLTDALAEHRQNGAVTAGLNVSGLLYHGGYTQNNMFGLKTDYAHLVKQVALMLLDEGCVLVLVPHVFPLSAVYGLESDLEACRKTADAVFSARPNAKLYLADAHYSHNQIKYLIGRCDFFAGSRMHSCIAALSQCVPAVGIAYSGKFQGVFDSVGQGEYVIDARQGTGEQIVDRVRHAFKNRSEQRQSLQTLIPQAQKEICEQFRRLPDGLIA